MILVDQNVRSCMRVSDHVYILELGQKPAEGDAEDISEAARFAR